MAVWLGQVIHSFEETFLEYWMMTPHIHMQLSKYFEKCQVASVFCMRICIQIHIVYFSWRNHPYHISQNSVCLEQSNFSSSICSFKMADEFYTLFKVGFLTQLVCMSLDFTDVPLRDDQREYLCKVAEG